MSRFAHLPRLWSATVLRSAVLLSVVGGLLSSGCQGVTPRGAGRGACPPPGTSAAGDLPPTAYTGVPGIAPPGACMMPAPPGMERGVPHPYQPVGPWAPPGIAGPWPYDEYLRDGGVAGPGVAVSPEWEVYGLGAEDAVAHYDTVDGRTIIEPTNPVYIYSPRFAAVRQVVSLVQNDQLDRTAGIHRPDGIVRCDDVQHVDQSKQNSQAMRQVGTKVVDAMRVRQGDGALSRALGPGEFQNGFQPYENIAAIRSGELLEAEMPFLAKGVTAAVAWTKDAAVQVILDQQSAMAQVGRQKLEEVYTVKGNPKPRLRVIKVASTQLAEPGDLVSFTIRFDNVGNQVIGNVTILDNLSSRLEYLPNTAQSSLPAKFSTQTNEVGSLVLRWEITPPVEAGRGGVIRFTCRVR